jgi:hypothetical protein
LKIKKKAGKCRNFGTVVKKVADFLAVRGIMGVQKSTVRRNRVTHSVQSAGSAG